MESYYVFRHLANITYKLFFIPKKEKQSAQVAATGKIDEMSKNSAIPASQEEMDLFKAIVKTMKMNIVDRDHKKLLSVIVTTNPKKELSPGVLKLLNFVRETYNREGVECIDFMTLFGLKYKETGLLPCWELDAHWNENGHQWVAEELYSKYIRNQIPHN